MEEMSQQKTIAITRSKDDSEEFIELISKHQSCSNHTSYHRTSQQRRKNC